MANSGKRLITATIARRQEMTLRIHNFVRGRSVARAGAANLADRRPSVKRLAPA
jgi:hypothetical protein